MIEMKRWTKLIASVGFAVAITASAIAQSLTVSSPLTGDFLGRSTQLKFVASNVFRQAKVVATTTSAADPSISFRAEAIFDPNQDNKIQGTLDLSFDEATPTGLYNIKVEYFEQGNLITSQNISNVTVDTKAPKFRNVVPGSSSYVSLLARIKAELEEPNVDIWRVKVGGRDIPNNTGNGNAIDVTWDTTLIEKDGPQTISIDVTDKARNSSSRSISVTIDRVKPTINILSPTNIGYRSGTTIPVQIDVIDQGNRSVTSQGVQVILKTMDGQFIQKVARRSVRFSGNNLQWAGRIRKTKRIPDQFKLIVQAVDRAGNVAQEQEIIVRYGR